MHGLRPGVVHARVEPEQEATFECSDSDVSAAPRKIEVKQQQDWRLCGQTVNLPNHRLLG